MLWQWWWTEVLHPAVVTTTSPTHQDLQLVPRGGNSALPKLTPTRAAQEAPHTHITLWLFPESDETQPANPKQIPCVWGFVRWQKTQRHGDGHGHGHAIFQGFTVKSLSSSISGAPSALSFFTLNPKMLRSQYCIQALKMKDLFLITLTKWWAHWSYHLSRLG